MPRFRGGRGLLRGVCWLVLLCVAEIGAAVPALAADPAGSETVALRAARDGASAAIPPAAPSAANPAVDDLSGPAASAPFRLPQPAVRHAGCPAAAPLSLLSHARALVGERGPPSPAR
jgi:hypothetical protein